MRHLIPQMKSNLSALVKYARRKGLIHDHPDFNLCDDCTRELQEIAVAVLPACANPSAGQTLAEEFGLLTEAFTFNRTLQEMRNRAGREAGT